MTAADQDLFVDWRSAYDVETLGGLMARARDKATEEFPQRLIEDNIRLLRSGSQAVGQHQPLRRAQCGVLIGWRRSWNFRLHQAHRGVDEQAVFDPAPGRSLGIERETYGLHGGAVSNGRMTVDAAQPDRPVADHNIDIGGCREALVGPQLLIPAAP